VQETWCLFGVKVKTFRNDFFFLSNVVLAKLGFWLVLVMLFCSETFFKKLRKGELLLIKMALLTILQPSPKGFELCILRLQGYAFTVELAPQVYRFRTLV